MPTPTTPLDETVWELPPLILHPFNERTSPAALLDNSKAALMLSGLIPSDGSEPDDLNRRLLAGRYGEVRMLYFLGKDVFRWLDQCMDWVSRVPALQDGAWRAQSFAALLTSGTPSEVKEKLVRWGVSDYLSIFCRAIGLNAMFTAPPVFETLAEEFLRNYHRYADALYRCYIESEPCQAADAGKFQFTLYASGEYSRMLESQWEQQGS
jgi:hypothetical protein